MDDIKQREREPGAIPVPADLRTLEWLCGQFRRDLLDLTKYSGTGSSHIGGSLSAVEILAVLYFHTMRLDPQWPEWPGRDRFILSKGHASAIQYVAMAWRGFFPRERLFDAFNRPHSIAQEHLNMDTPGAEIPTGPLGMGLSAGVGMAWASRYASRTRGAPLCRVFAVLSDGECTSGQTWEAAMAAAQFELENLVAIVDYNKRFVTGPTDSIMSLEPFCAKWEAFGWHAAEVDGHDLAALVEGFDWACGPKTAPGQPRVLIAHTVKGRGISFMESDDSWHSGHLGEEDYVAAMQEVSDGTH